MRVNPRNSLLMAGFLSVIAITSPPVLAQTHGLSQQQPSEQDIERFCGNWGQLSGSEKEQYRDQYERYCRDEPVFGQPVAPEPQTTIMQPAEPQQPSSQQQQPQEPQQPGTPEKPEPAEPEIRPTKPEPVIPAPEPLRVDLVGRLELVGPLARSPGERQRLRVTVENLDAGGGPHAPVVNRLWARVFLSEREVSRRGASAGAFSFSGRQRGQPVRLPGLPAPGRTRDAMVEVPLPATLEEGNYWWCVQVDSRQAIEETDEGNNIACAQKVVAIGGESDSELSEVFGSKVAALDELETANEMPEVARNLRIDLPAYVQPLMDEVPVLTVNGADPMAPVTVAEGDSAVTAWDFPAESEVDEIFLRVHDDPFTRGCPAPGTSRSAGRAELEGCPACRVEADDGFRDDASGWHNLQLAEHYDPGAAYYLQACGLAGGVFNGTQTNTVTMGYGATPPGAMAMFPIDPSLVAGLADAGITGLPEMPEVPVRPPDFIVRHIGVSNRPESEGQLLIRISDQSGRWFDYLSEHRRDGGPWSVVMPITIKVDGEQLTRPSSSERPAETGGDRGSLTGPRIFPDASYGVFIPPTGEAVVRVPTAMYELPAGGAHRVEVSINLSGDGAVIPETNTANNTDTRALRRELPKMRVGAMATRFRVETVGESDQESPAEMQEIYLRVCNESTGACSDQAAFYSGGGDIRHDGSSRPADPVEVFAGEVVVIAPDPYRYLEVAGTRDDWFHIEVTAFEWDPCPGLIRACGRSGNKAIRRGSFRVPVDVAASSSACQLFEPSLGGWVESGSSKGPHLTPLNTVVRVCYPAGDE